MKLNESEENINIKPHGLSHDFQKKKSNIWFTLTLNIPRMGFNKSISLKKREREKTQIYAIVWLIFTPIDWIPWNFVYSNEF